MPTKLSGTRISARPPRHKGEDADGEHCQHVVEPANGMHEAVDEAGSVAMASMGKGGSGQANEQQTQYRAHNRPFSLKNCLALARTGTGHRVK